MSVARCHLCRAQLGADAIETSDGLQWCADLVACKAQARRRLGIPREVAERHRRIELEQLARERDAVSPQDFP